KLHQRGSISEKRTQPDWQHGAPARELAYNGVVPSSQLRQATTLANIRSQIVKLGAVHPGEHCSNRTRRAELQLDRIQRTFAISQPKGTVDHAIDVQISGLSRLLGGSRGRGYGHRVLRLRPRLRAAGLLPLLASLFSNSFIRFRISSSSCWSGWLA